MQEPRLRRIAARAAGRAAGPTAGARRAPRGPALRTWRRGYRDLVSRVAADGSPWLLITPGSPLAIRQGRGRRATPYPSSAGNPPLTNDLAFVAELEARRFDGHRHLVLPEGSRPWFRERAELRGHLTGRYRTVTDRPLAGAVYDLSRRAEPGGGSLRAEVAQLTAGLVEEPAVLDWTERGIDLELPGVTTFRPPDGDRLPYLDHSVEIVVHDASRDPEEAARVASRGVLTVVIDDAGTTSVTGVDARLDPSPAAAPRTLLWSTDPSDDPAWRAALADAAAEAGAELRLGAADGPGPDDLADIDVVVIVEPYVLPIADAVATASAQAEADPSSAVVGKVVAANGRLEAAGATVFTDRSVALIAHGSAEVRAPWHDYVRPVCWAPGLLAVATPLWVAVPPPDDVTGRAFLREWCAQAWATGHAVTYQPTVAAVRVAGSGAEAATPLPDSRWQRVLDLRPRRPRDLSDGAWRHLLANDDVEACRG